MKAFGFAQWLRAASRFGGIQAWIFVPPTLAIFLFGVIFYYEFKASQVRHDAIEQYEFAVVERLRNISGLAYEISRINAVLLDTTGAPEYTTEIHNRIQPHLNRLHVLGEDLETRAEAFATAPAGRQVFARVVGQFASYRKEAGLLMRPDAGSSPVSSALPAPANTEYRRLIEALSELNSINLDQYQAAADGMEENERNIRLGVLTGLALAAIASLLLAWLISRYLSRDFGRLIGSLTEISEGGKSRARLDLDRRDEIGAMSRAIVAFEEVFERLGIETGERRRRERDLLTLFEYSGDAILIVQDGRYVAANRKAEELFECSRDEILSLPVGSFSEATEGDGDRAHNLLFEYLAEPVGSHVAPIEWRSKTTTGRVFPSELTVTAMAGPDGESVHQIMIRDISERMDVERLRSSMTEELEKRVAARTAELRTEIDARREAERALDVARKLTETTIENAPIGIVVLDEESRVLLFNSEFKRAQGAVAQDLAVGMNFQDILVRIRDRRIAADPERVVGIKKVYDDRIASLKGREDAVLEGFGEAAALKINRRYIPGFGYVITNVDISDLKEAERETERARRTLDVTLENAPSGILLLDEELCVQVANSWYRSAYEIPRDQPFIGRKFETVLRGFLERRLTGVPDEDQAYRAEIEARIDDFNSRRDGEIIDTLPGGRILKITRSYVDGVGYVVTYVDITDITRVETALKEQRRLLDATIENAPVGIAVLDDDLCVRLINGQFRQMHGRVADAIAVGSNFEDFLRTVAEREVEKTPAKREQLYATLKSRLESLHRRESVEFGSIVANLKINRRYIPGFGYVISYVDISELTAIEANLRQTLEELEHAQDELVNREKMAALGGLVAGLAHEINTPIGVCVTATSHISDLLGRLRRQLANGEPGNAVNPEIDQLATNLDEVLSIVQRNLKRASGLVSSFKMVAVDQTDDDLRGIEFGTYIGEIVKSLAAETRRAKLDVVIEPSAGPINCYTYPGAIAQILTNLIMNAIVHAYEAGIGGRLEIVLSEVDQDNVSIIVRDFGKGMDARTLARVFEPFFTTRRGQGGTGLGLHIAYNLATQRLGGTIQCRSEEGAWTEFELRLPLDVEESTVLDNLDGMVPAS